MQAFRVQRQVQTLHTRVVPAVAMNGVGVDIKAELLVVMVAQDHTLGDQVEASQLMKRLKQFRYDYIKLSNIVRYIH